MTSFGCSKEYAMILLDAGIITSLITILELDEVDNNVVAECFELLNQLAKAVEEASENICSKGSVIMDVFNRFIDDNKIVKEGMVFLFKYRVFWKL